MGKSSWDTAEEARWEHRFFHPHPFLFRFLKRKLIPLHTHLRGPPLA